ncbi:LysR substrate-binding domain-containing protein [Paraburkholderia sp. RL18-101-BIB-B]|uniref:LysR substrate-binding domain-containing protein n=1 Tax=Paraburkholderia sp. RL18-101-BIB-B TaxID=3031634 RepID=UPI0038BABA5F
MAADDSLLRGVADKLGIEGSITIGSTVSSMGFLAANVIRPRVSYPGLKVRLAHGNSAELERQVCAGEIDAAVIVSEPRATTLPESWEHLYDEPLVLLLNPAIAPADGPSSTRKGRREVAPLPHRLILRSFCKRTMLHSTA